MSKRQNAIKKFIEAANSYAAEVDCRLEIMQWIDDDTAAIVGIYDDTDEDPTQMCTLSYTRSDVPYNCNFCFYRDEDKSDGTAFIKVPADLFRLMCS